MNTSHENSQGMGAPARRARVLSVGKMPELLVARNELLRQAGYDVTAAVGAEQALQALQGPHEIVVFGHMVPEHERNLIAGAARSSCPAVKVIMLYLGAIQNAQLADALLSVMGSGADLLRTIEHLLDQASSPRRPAC